MVKPRYHQFTNKSFYRLFTHLGHELIAHSGSEIANQTGTLFHSGMRIATYNINGVNGHLPVLLRWLDETRPDVVCLQELKAPQDKFPWQAIQEAGYQAVWQGQKSWNGVAILSKSTLPLERRRSLPGDDQDSHSRYLEAEVNGLIVGCLYLPNGNPAPGPKLTYKLSWMQRLQAHAAQLLTQSLPVVLAGDYNVIPSEQDVDRPERWINDALFLPEVRSAYQQLLAQGWTDALRTLYPDTTIYTFWDYFRHSFSRNAGLRIDHFLLSPDLSKGLQAGGVDRQVRGWEKTSDHAPVWIELALTP